MEKETNYLNCFFFYSWLEMLEKKRLGNNGITLLLFLCVKLFENYLKIKLITFHNFHDKHYYGQIILLLLLHTPYKQYILLLLLLFYFFLFLFLLPTFSLFWLLLVFLFLKKLCPCICWVQCIYLEYLYLFSISIS